MNNRNALTREAEALYNAINRFRCIRIEQLKYFMPPTKSTRQNYHEAICTHLSIKKLGNMSGEYMFAANESTVSQDMIDSIWVMIDMLSKNPEIPVSNGLQNAFNPAYPCTVTFIEDNFRIVKLLPVLTAGDIIKIYAENEKYAILDEKTKEENRTRLMYVIIIRDESLLDEIARISPVFPHKIAYLQGEYNTKPEIEYYS